MSRKFTKRVLVHPDLGSLPSSMPLIIPNDREYDISTNTLLAISGERRTGLKIVSETLRLLESINRPVAVTAICGPCRTGKSYVLSRMLGSADAFELGHTMDAKTFGIWVGTTVLDCDEFTLLLMDTEGIDAVSATMKDDASVLVMTVLLSSCLIYNSLGVPKHNDLQKMSHFAQLATSIAVSASANATGESEDDDSLELKHYFPDFLWLLRDVTLIPTGEDGKEVAPTEYLKTKVLRRSRGFRESESDQIARAILTVFPTIACRTIQPPSSDPTVMRNIASKQSSLDPKFNAQVEDLVQHLFDIVREKKGIGAGKTVDGTILAAMATQYLEAVNKPDAIPCISDTWQTAIRMRCDKVIVQLLTEYDQAMEQRITSQGLPMEEDLHDDDPKKPTTLFGIHRAVLLQMTTELLNQVGHFLAAYAPSGGSSSALNKNSLCAELEAGAAEFTEEEVQGAVSTEQSKRKKVTGGNLFKFAQQNHAESHASCIRLFAKLYEPIEQKVKKADKSYTFEKLMKDLHALDQDYERQAVGPAKWDVYNEKRAFIKTQQDSFKLLHGFKQKAFDMAQQAADAKAEAAKLQDSMVALQTQAKNDAEMNRRRIEELQEHQREEMEKFRKDEQEKMEKERQRTEDFMKAQMKEMAEISKESREQMKQQYDLTMQMMKDMNDQNERSMKTLETTSRSLADAISNMPKPGCFAAGTTVTCTDGSQLAIEKQAAGIKVLAIGGEPTTITEEFVNQDLDAGEQLFGINEDTPFSALHHPFWTTEGWKCLSPELAKEENPSTEFKLLQVGDIVFRIAQTDPLLYEPVRIRRFTFTTLSEPIKIYGLHLDGPRSYHANGYIVAANYPVLTKKRVMDGMKRLSEEEKDKLKTAISSAQHELTKVFGSWANSAFQDMGLVEQEKLQDD